MNDTEHRVLTALGILTLTGFSVLLALVFIVDQCIDINPDRNGKAQVTVSMMGIDLLSLRR